MEKLSQLWAESLSIFLDWLKVSGWKIVLIAILSYIAILLLPSMIKPMLRKKSGMDEDEFKKRADTLFVTLRSFFIVVIITIAAFMILGEFGLKLGPILAAAGVVGVAVGFGAQHLIRDLINGFFILLDDQIRVGDVVDIGGKAGLVERLNLRLTTLRDLSGNVHYVPNGEITVVTNMTKEYSRYVFDIGVAYRENVDEVIDVIKQVDDELRNDPVFKDNILEPIEILGLDKFADSAIIIKARTKTKPIQQWAVGREFNRRLKVAFDARDIEIPFPHVTLYPGQNKDGSAPPLNVSQN